MIKEEKESWLRRARGKRKAFRDADDYEAHSPFWSEIKAVFMRLQKNKCIYCERKLEDETVGKIEWDLEHFRPKDAVKAWTHPEIDFPTSAGRDKGYHQLAYHPFNYLASCKPCNSALKAAYFPIEGPRAEANARQPSVLEQEKPFFLYPLGTADTNPEEVLTYHGYLALPNAKSGFNHRRARVSILCFGLNRDSLQLLRAKAIEHIWLALRLVETGNAADKRNARQTITRLLRDEEAHAGCIRAFHRLYLRDAKKAQSVYQFCAARLGG